ncbi:MAG: glutamate racemase [Deltaproteobacteria bacterium]|nr:glutamate racemase [Deltaproteobacteria bacterium]
MRPCPEQAKQTKIFPVTKESAIGIFDSGVGGLTVLQQIARLLPRELLVYLGDTARYPYGSKSSEVVTQYSCENTDFLMDRGLKMLVVACNTASAVALPTLRERYALPVIGVIEPGAHEACRRSQNRRIGIIGTKATISSGAYTQALRTIDPSVEVYSRACPLFVPLVEEGWVDNEVARATIAVYLGSLKHSGIDTLILGCTHYPLLKRAIASFLGPSVGLVDSAEQTATAVSDALASAGLLRRKGAGSASFFVTDEPDRFVKVGAPFLGHQVESAVRVESCLWSPLVGRQRVESERVN